MKLHQPIRPRYSPPALAGSPTFVPLRAGQAKPRAPKITICPSVPFDPRYQCAPGEAPFGAGFSHVGLGRDIRTGQEWA